MSFADARRDSPCIDVCRIDPATGWCEGCRRSLDEIAAWGGLDAGSRRRILDDLPRRAGSVAAAVAPGAMAAEKIGQPGAMPPARGPLP